MDPTSSGIEKGTFNSWNRAPVGTRDAQFYLAFTLTEPRGIEALELMHDSMDDIFVGDAITLGWYMRNALTIDGLKGCDLDVLHHYVRPRCYG
ncbi:hypothetical protein EDD16DRAFT_1577665 [Pisolithus croceorrhizus]|nr:hypothetical protein EDD16DRAFT_1577665 [Pisolithus croceorrhizus]